MELPIPYGRQTITDSDIEAVVETLRSPYLTQGPRIAEFERAFARYVGAPYAVAVNNATAGLHIAAAALGVAPGKKVIVTPLTFAASANCIRYCGGEVVFCDIDPDTRLMDAGRLEEIINAHPAGTFAGIVAVDFAGYPHNLEQFREIADRHGLWIIEDACHAPGAWFTAADGERHFSGSGRFADCSVFSFHPVKHIATGEGGMVTTANPEIYARLLSLRSHGITRDPELLHENHGGWYYEMQELGFNYRITDIQAALGLSQLSRAEEGLARRRRIADRYDEALRNEPGITIPYRNDSVGHAFHLYVIEVDDRPGDTPGTARRSLYDFLRGADILAQVHYVPVHLMPYYRELGSAPGDCPVAERYYTRCLSLPMFPALTDEQQQYVIDKVKEWNASR
ncbi:MAG: UDP-4-amino-4,6-dideoxy-N-acetyl-beta-L-altrosamine transaminase [Bacteroidales bacterium]|nr:UDP-4-amino-4,6-dideoxy-N-acetyl-beta-L-altrosamine transaminase [Bacteroidales bacterium]MBD5172565.1 UDP-4-amino-4,6-dideoxy-N-acetyl-beta-L-altrosamine transaminase [Bacteroidales bacterium]